MNTMRDLNSMQRQQISLLQQSIWQLNEAGQNIKAAIGNSALDRVYVEQLSDLIDSLEEDINNIRDE